MNHFIIVENPKPVIKREKTCVLRQIKISDMDKEYLFLPINYLVRMANVANIRYRFKAAFAFWHSQ